MMATVHTLDGKIALVTGGSRGIGACIAKTLASAGAKVALTYHSEKAKAEEVVTAIAETGGSAMAVQLESGDRASAEATLKEVVSTFGAPDILVNNAAKAQEKPFETISDEDWEAMLGCNLLGPMQLIQLCLPAMRSKNWGRIVNISSIGGQWGGERQVHYAASKAALINLTMSMARLYSRDGITCNAIAPGLVPTDMTASELNDPANQAKVKSIPAGRLSTVDEVADACLFLASDSAGYITGQTINLNGGMYFG